MTNPATDNRLFEDWQKLRDLSDHSEFWQIDELAENEDGHWDFGVCIKGRCLASAGTEQPEPDYCEQQQIRLTFDADYPRSAPRIEIQSPVFHPNIASDGIVSFSDLDLTWSPELSLDRVLSCLWDTLRGNRVDVNNAIHVGAGQWYAQHTGKDRLRLPLDERPFIETSITPTNIVRYRRLGQPFREYQPGDSIVIDESSAGPELPRQRPATDSPIHFIE